MNETITISTKTRKIDAEIKDSWDDTKEEILGAVQRLLVAEGWNKKVTEVQNCK